MSKETLTPNHWLIITNPTAGKRRYKRQRRFVQNELDKAGISYILKLTAYSGHAIEIAKEYTKRGCLNFLVLGGDGTVSEVVNGIFAAQPKDSSKIKLALLPRGTGNDWGRFWKLTKNDKASLAVFLKGKTQLIDIGKVDYRDKEKLHKERYFINSIGFGLDAEVVNVTHRMKKYIGSFSPLYTVALVSAVFGYKSFPTKLKINDKEYNPLLFTMNIANGPYTGGGIKQNPQAVPYDGIFDMMFVEKPTVKDILTALGKLFNGKLAKHPAINYFRTKEVSVEVEKHIPVEADGLILKDATNYSISIIPNAIQMVVP